MKHLYVLTSNRCQIWSHVVTVDTKEWSDMFEKESKLLYKILSTVCLQHIQCVLVHWSEPMLSFSSYARLICGSVSHRPDRWDSSGSELPVFLSRLWGGGRTAGIRPRCKTPQSEINSCRGKSQGSGCLMVCLTLGLKEEKRATKTSGGKGPLTSSLIDSQQEGCGFEPWGWCPLLMSAWVSGFFPPTKTRACEAVWELLNWL